MVSERLLNPPLLRGWIGGGGGGGGGGAVSSVFTRTGAVVAQAGDYTAAQVTSAADLSSSSQQAFTGEVSAPDYVASGLTGATAASRYVGATTSGAPASGTHSVGDFAIAQNGHIFVCTVLGTPGTWVDVGSVGNAVTSVFSRTGVVVAQSGDYTASQVTNAADKSSGSQQLFTAEVKAPDLVAGGLTGATAASRYVGATTAGAPTTGTFSTGDFVVDQLGRFFVCISGGTPGTWMRVSGGGWSAQVDLRNTNTIQTILSQSIPGNTLGANGGLLVTVSGLYQNNSGSTRGITLQVSFGGTTMWGDATSSSFIASTTDVYPFFWQFLLYNANATNSQRMAGRVGMGEHVAASIAGNGKLDTQAEVIGQVITGGSSVDTTSAQTLLLQATNSAQNASLGLVVHTSVQSVV